MRASGLHSDNTEMMRDNGQRKRKMDCSGDGDSVSSLPSTLAAYIREEHQHSGGIDCLTLNSAEVDDRDTHNYFKI